MKKKDSVLKVYWTKIRKFWHYVWNGDDFLSLVLSVILAFIIIKFLFYPVVGLALSTTHPIVAIVSGSMEHDISNHEKTIPNLCGREFEKTGNLKFDSYWKVCGEWYEDIGISKDRFLEFRFKNGMNIGDIIILRNPGADKIKVGDVIVFIQEKNPAKEPIIHRVVDINDRDGKIFFHTKGDHNQDSINVTLDHKYLNEYEVSEDELVGRSLIRVPWLGYVKILAYDAFMWVRGLLI